MLAKGPIVRTMLTMGIPAFIAQLINLLYNIIDRMYIGHIKDIGAMALTGVGISFPIITLITAFAMLVGAGGAPLAGIEFGKGEKEKAENILIPMANSSCEYIDWYLSMSNRQLLTKSDDVLYYQYLLHLEAELFQKAKSDKAGEYIQKLNDYNNLLQTRLYGSIQQPEEMAEPVDTNQVMEGLEDSL